MKKLVEAIISLMYSKKRRGHRTDLWGTPISIKNAILLQKYLQQIDLWNKKNLKNQAIFVIFLITPEKKWLYWIKWLASWKQGSMVEFQRCKPHPDMDFLWTSKIFTKIGNSVDFHNILYRPSNRCLWWGYELFWDYLNFFKKYYWWGEGHLKVELYEKKKPFSFFFLFFSF